MKRGTDIAIFVGIAWLMWLRSAAKRAQQQLVDQQQAQRSYYDQQIRKAMK